MANDIEKAINKLANSPPAFQVFLDPKPAADAVQSQRGVGRQQAAQSASGAGAGGDLTEISFASREYWTDQTLTSSDGVFSLVWRPPKKISLKDTDGNTVMHNYASP